VAKQDVRLLDSWRVRGRHTDTHIGDLARRAPALARHRDGDEALPSGGAQSFENIRRVATGRQPDGDVAGRSEGVQLPSKDELEGHVIADRGQRTGVNG